MSRLGAPGEDITPCAGKLGSNLETCAELENDVSATVELTFGCLADDLVTVR